MIAAPQWVYPSCDGEPMADNTYQYDWISVLKWGAEYYFHDRSDVFVAADHLIYPVKGDLRTRQAPDVYMAFGRPKRNRENYRVWEEGGVFPQVVLEVWSPGLQPDRMREKFDFYERYGVEEFYIVYPEYPAFVQCWVRVGDMFEDVTNMPAHVSPRLGWRFIETRGQLTVHGPDGQALRRPDEIAVERDAAVKWGERLATKLRQLGVDPDAV